MKRTITLAAAAIMAATAALAQTSAMKMEEVPAEIRAAAMAASRGGKIESVQVELERGKAIYEFKVTLPDGKNMEVDVDSSGRIEEIEEVIDRAAVPPAAMQTLMRVLPNFQPTLFERSTRANFEIYYEFEGRDARGVEIDVEVRADGKVVLIADDDAN